MIDAVKMDVEEQSGHLAESEVARLLAVLQNAEFKRSETRNITKDNSFKPRSLMEIAIEAQQRDAEIELVFSLKIKHNKALENGCSMYFSEVSVGEIFSRTT